MKWIAKAFRHSHSVQMIIPKQLIREMNWGYNTHFLIEKLDAQKITISSLDEALHPTRLSETGNRKEKENVKQMDNS